MPRLQLPDASLISYESTGDGFPLVLLPGAEGIAAWLPHLPLLGELCHAIAYECCQPPAAAEYLPALLDILRLERVYLASPVPGWLPTLEFACRHPETLEALLLVDLPGDANAGETPLADPALSVRLSGMSLPTLILLADDDGPARRASDRLSAHFLHSRTVTMSRPGQGQADLPATPRRQFPHLMMQFLLDRERHRNLVRGASFLL
jgi:hypothetical protein